MRGLFSLFVGLSLACAASASDYYVDGRSGLDRTDHGAAPDKPWKTITYALQHIPPPSGSATHTLHVAGAQTYALTTNGESFPIVAVPGVSLVGSGVRPVLASTGSGAILSLPSGKAVPPETRFENLGLHGGWWGITLGGTAQDHAPRIIDCEFEGQGSDGIHLVPGGFSLTAPRVTRCTFKGGKHGIFVLVSRSSPLVREVFVALTVEECSFAGHGRAGVFVDQGHDHPELTAVGVRIQGSWFEDCDYGVEFATEDFDEHSRAELEVIGCAFRRCRYFGVSVFPSMYGGRFDHLVVDRCSFVEGGSQSVAVTARVDGSCLLRGNFVRGGLRGFGIGRGRTVIEGNLVTGCSDGCSITSDRLPLAVDATGNRFLGNARGIRIAKAPAGSTVTLASSIVADSSRDGLHLDTEAKVTGRGLTVANNAATGLVVAKVHQESSFDHCIFSKNGIEVSGSIGIDWSVFEKQDFPGTGNRKIDPLLDPTTYKLLPTSPCIDAGNPALVLPASDYEGDPRVLAGPRGTFPDIGADEHASMGSVHPYGVAGFGRHDLRPVIVSPDQRIAVGEVLQIDLRQAKDTLGRVAGAALLTLGVADRSELDLGGIGAAGSHLWTDLRTVLPPAAVDRRGVASLNLRVPAVAELYGRTLTFQWLVFHPPANAAGLVTTGGLRATLGR